MFDPEARPWTAAQLADAIAGRAAGEKAPVRRKKRAPVVPADTAVDPGAVLQVHDLSIAVDDGPALDDVLDAVAAAWSARRWRDGEALTFGPSPADRIVV